jgi:MFS family permease
LLTRDFRLVWWSQLLSQVADGVSKLALLWFVYSVTGSPVKTTIIGVLQTVPPILFSPLIGVCVDRFPKKIILITTDVARAILIGVIPCMISTERFTVESLYVLVFLYGIATAMFVPTLSSSVPFMVSRPQFTAANALLQSTTSIGIIMGPALSGLGIAMSGSQEVLCLNAVTYLASAACLLPIRLISEPPGPRPGHAWTALMRELIDGMRYAFAHRSILLIILMASFYTFAAGAFTTLFPVFGKKLLDLGPVEVGYLWSWLGIGLLLVSIGLVPLTTWEMRRRIQAIALSSLIGGTALCALVWAHGLLSATLLVSIIGMGLGMWTPIAWGMIQEISPAHMVGRVMSIYTAIATAASMVGMTAFGWIIEAFNERIGLLGIGMILFIMAAVAAGFRERVAKWHT